MFTKTIGYLLVVICFVVGGSVWAHDKPLKVGVTPHGMPFTFLEPRTHHIQGLMVDIINEIAADSGLKIEFETMFFAQLIPSLQQRRIDLTAAGMFITPKRKEAIDFSHPLFSFGEALIVPNRDKREYARMEDLKGLTIGVQRGTVFVDTLQKTGFIDVKLYDHVKHLMDDVNSGLIQGGFADQPVIAYHLKQGEFPHTRMVRSFTPTTIGSMGIGIRKGDAALLTKINASLEKLKQNGTIDRILARWEQ